MGKKKTFGSCAYCGRNAKLTDDHIPPQSMFPAGTTLIKVPACRECNGGAAGDDEYFAAALALRIEVAENPVVKGLLPKLMRGLRHHGRSGHTGSIITTMKPVELRSEAGLYLGRSAIFAPDDDRMARVAARIIRGLYYHEFHERFPETHGVNVNIIGRVSPTNETDREGWQGAARRLIDIALKGRRVVVHPRVFHYGVNVVKDEEGQFATIWVMQFYDYTPTLCISIRRDLYPDGAGALLF